MIGKLLNLPVALIDDGPNVRARADDGLKKSILEHGLLQPIAVTPLEDDRYQCLYGHRRLAAVRALGHETIAAVVQKLPEELPLRQLVENQQRKAVDQLDVARTLRAFLDDTPGARVQDLAEKLGRSTYWVSTRLSLLDMDQDLQEKVAAGEATVTNALAAHKASTPQIGRGRKRSLRSDGGGTAKVVVELESPSHQSSSQATIEVDRSVGRVEFLLEDGEGYGVMVAMSAEGARVLGMRLTQAYQALKVPVTAGERAA